MHYIKFYALVELGAVLLVKLKSISLCQMLCAGAIALYTSEKVKLTPAEEDLKDVAEETAAAAAAAALQEKGIWL